MSEIEKVIEAEYARMALGHIHVEIAGMEYIHPEVSAAEVASAGSIPEGAAVRLCRSAACLS
jgi:hypothetical protein